MACIHLSGVSVEFPVFSAASRSLKNRVLSLATGGVIEGRADGRVVVRGLDGIDLRVQDGERLGIVGHNGAGKTTLLRVLTGIYQPTRGRATIEGKCVPLINIGLGIDPEATGRENIRLRGAMMGLGAAAVREMFDEIADFSGLGAFLDMPFRTYSSGMQLRLAFATSTAVQPEILIMDEWLSTGDADFTERANQRLRTLVDTTKILVLASHSRELLLANCSRIVWLEHGCVRMDGPATQVAQAYFGH